VVQVHLDEKYKDEQAKESLRESYRGKIQAGKLDRTIMGKEHQSHGKKAL